MTMITIEVICAGLAIAGTIIMCIHFTRKFRALEQRLDDVDEEVILLIKECRENKDCIKCLKNDHETLKSIYIKDLLHPWVNNKKE